METGPNDAQRTTSKVLESSSPPLIRIPQLGVKKNQKSPCADAVRKKIETPRNTSRAQSEGESEDEVFPPEKQEETLRPMRGSQVEDLPTWTICAHQKRTYLQRLERVQCLMTTQAWSPFKWHFLCLKARRCCARRDREGEEWKPSSGA